MSIDRVLALSPRSVYRYLAETLNLRLLAETGDAAVVPNPPYLLRVCDSLASDWERRGEACSASLRRVMEVVDQNGSVPASEVRRRTTVALECVARWCGESTDDAVAAARRERAPEAAGEPTVPEQTDAAAPVRIPIVLYLPHVRSPYNLGGIIRTAAAFGVAGVVVGADCPSLDHPRARRAAMGAHDLVTVVTGDLDTAVELLRRSGVSGTVTPIVLETGGRPIDEVSLPAAGVLIAGHEELGVPEELLAPFVDADDRGGDGPSEGERGAASGRGPESDRGAPRDHGMVVSIPHGGAKRSLNVTVAVGIALSWWTTKKPRR